MSIYRTILEEELDMPILDDDNSPELKAIEDIVADQDANATEQDDAREAAFGPSEGVSDIMDESAIIIAEAEMDFNKIMMAIGIYEASEMASGREVIYEGADIKGFFKTAKEKIVTFFKKVWQVLQRFVANFTSIFHTNKGLATKYKSQIEAGYKALDKKNDNKMKMWPYTGLNDMLKKRDWLNSTSNSAIEIAIRKSKELNANSDYTLTKEGADNAVKAYREKICDDKCDANDFREKLLKKIRGADEKKEGLMPVGDVMKGLDCSEDVKASRKALDEAKKEYKDAIKRLNDLERSISKKVDYSYRADPNDKESIEKDEANTVAKNALQSVIIATSMLREALSACQVARATILSSAKGRMMQARYYAHAYIFAANKANDKYKGFQKESAEYGFLSNMDLV